jgi:hypothetical protein
MSGKCDTHADKQPKDKNKRKMMSPSEKVALLFKLHKGINSAAVRNHYDEKADWKMNQ